MAVAIRLKREGAKNRPYYKIVVADSAARATANSSKSSAPTIRRRKGENFTLELERAEYWVGVGARPSQTVGSIINKARKKARSRRGTDARSRFLAPGRRGYRKSSVGGRRSAEGPASAGPGRAELVPPEF